MSGTKRPKKKKNPQKHSNDCLKSMCQLSQIHVVFVSKLLVKAFHISVERTYKLFQKRIL